MENDYTVSVDIRKLDPNDDSDLKTVAKLIKRHGVKYVFNELYGPILSEFSPLTIACRQNAFKLVQLLTKMFSYDWR